MFYVLSDGRVLRSVWDSPFKSVTWYFPQANVTVRHLDEPQLYREYINRVDRQAELKWFIECHGEKKGHWLYRRWINRVKRRTVDKWVYPRRWIATWEYDGRKYECIYGYGVDSDEEVWRDVKMDYGFTEKEIEVISEWFES